LSDPLAYALSGTFTGANLTVRAQRFGGSSRPMPFVFTVKDGTGGFF